MRPPPGLSPLRRFWWWFHFLILVKLARLRFIAILFAIGAVIIYWETLYAYYQKWTRPFSGEEQVASTDTEFWCPMHPTVVREKPDKCPICGMPLSKRKKGETSEAEPLPAGVLHRVQLSPDRVISAGIQTTELTYQPLSKKISTVGFVEFDERKLEHIAARVKGRIDKLYVNVTGQMVKKDDPLALLNIRYGPELSNTVQDLLRARQSDNREMERSARERLRFWDITDEQIDEMLRTGKKEIHLTIRSSIGGHIIKKYQVEGKYVDEGSPLYDVADLSTVWLQAQVYEEDLGFLREGLAVRATTSAFRTQRFTGELAFINPHLDRTSRTVTVRFDMKNPDHQLRPGMYTTVTIDIPASELGQGFVTQNGLALAVPEKAVIDTGTRKFVFREYLPAVYDKVEVEFGPRMAGPDSALFYPVVRGLDAGDKVATAGSFLLDAETRLTSGAASTYFGASGGSQAERRSTITGAQAAGVDEETMVKAALAKLSTPDRRLAEAQGFCPILQDNRLGSMGVPVKLMVKEQPVFLCCAGCKEKALAKPEQTLATVEKLKAQTKGAAKQEPRAPATSGPAPTPEDQAEIKAALAKLSPEDRRLAEAQKLCAVKEKNLLGSMGTPFKVMVKGQPVFLCCEACKDEALANPDRTLARVQKLKGTPNAESPSK